MGQLSRAEAPLPMSEGTTETAYQRSTFRLDSRLSYWLMDRARTGDEAAMEQIIHDASPLVQHIAWKKDIPNFPYTERVDIGLSEVPGAVVRYDRRNPQRAKFSTFLATRVSGALIDELRARREISRHDYDQLVQAAEAKAGQRDELDALYRAGFWAAPSLVVGDKVADSLGTVRIDAQVAVAQQAFSGASSREELIDSGRDTVHQATLSLRVREIFSAIDNLPDRHRKIFLAKTGLGGESALSLDEIAAQEGVTQSRASQLVTEARDMLRAAITSEEIDLAQFSQNYPRDTDFAGQFPNQTQRILANLHLPNEVIAEQANVSPDYVTAELKDVSKHIQAANKFDFLRIMIVKGIFRLVSVPFGRTFNLTSREMEFFVNSYKDTSNAATAEKLDMKTDSVARQKQALMRALGATNVRQATLYAVRDRRISLLDLV